MRRVTRRNKGQSLVECLFVLCFLVPIIGLIVDVSVYASAINLNSEASRSAALAASKGQPIALSRFDPVKNAQAAVVSLGHSDSDGLIALSANIEIIENISTLPSAPFGGAVEGDVTATTTVQVVLPFTDRLLRRKPTSLQASHTFPYRWVVPPTDRIDQNHGTDSMPRND